MLSRIYLLYDEDESMYENGGLIFVGEREKAQDKVGELIKLTKDDYAEGSGHARGVLRYRLSEVTTEDGMIVNQKNIDI